MKTVLPLLLAAGLAAAAARAADNPVTATAPLSRPGQPATLVIDLPWAAIRIDGTDTEAVTVESTLARKSAAPVRPGGLRRLDDEVSFELAEQDNVVSLRLAGDNPRAGHDAEFRLQVPRAIALRIKAEPGGDLEIRDVQGDIEVSTMNGEVRLEGLVGSAVINSLNGEVRAVYTRAPVKPVSITSMNGQIDLRVPADTKASVRMNTLNGSILTDFDEAALKTTSEGSRSHHRSGTARSTSSAETRHETEEAGRRDSADAGTPAIPRPPRPPRVPRPPLTGGKIVTGTLNGGGVDIKLSTLNGEISLRQAKAETP
ncbi:MAG: DUF4097 family beta strand repeat protein [Opitutaceae bacterium]|nr:DUF4097 family beta strand repeat protein [Opitutaceae bacterium]